MTVVVVPESLAIYYSSFRKLTCKSEETRQPTTAAHLVSLCLQHLCGFSLVATLLPHLGNPFPPVLSGLVH